MGSNIALDDELSKLVGENLISKVGLRLVRLVGNDPLLFWKQN